jgi:hypothetical protein
VPRAVTVAAVAEACRKLRRETLLGRVMNLLQIFAEKRLSHFMKRTKFTVSYDPARIHATNVLNRALSDKRDVTDSLVVIR